MKLLELRKRLKRKKPDFARQDSHKHPALKKKWRRPKGLQSKMRLHKKGYSMRLKMGYKSPALVRGLHPSGLKIVHISQLSKLEMVNPKIEGILISSTLGTRKKLILLEKASEKGIRVFNVKDPKAFTQKTQSDLQKRKESRKNRLEKKAKASTKPKKDKKKAEKIDDKVKKDLDKKEKDKILTKRD